MPVLYEKRDNVGWITLSRPGARNAWGPDYYDGLAQYFDEMEEDDEVRCVVITGDDSAGAFSAGANLKDPNTHNTGSPAKFLRGLVEETRCFAFRYVQRFPETGNRRRERLCHRDRLHHHLLLRFDRGLRESRMAVAADRPWNHSGLRGLRTSRALGRQRAGDAARNGVSVTGRGGLSHRPRAMANAA